MRRFLLFLSAVLLSVAASWAADGDEPVMSMRQAFEIEMDRGYLSGILITVDRGNEIAGSMVNEFGISAIDFKYDKESQKVKLTNVVKFLDKWYIRRVLAEDLGLCIRTLYGIDGKLPRKHRVSILDETVVIDNDSRNLHYRFSPLTP